MLSTWRSAASRQARPVGPGSAVAAASSSARPAGSTPADARRAASAAVNTSPPAHERHPAAGTGTSWRYSSATRAAAGTHRSPKAGSITSTRLRRRRHSTTKWVNPSGNNVTATAGRYSCGKATTCSAGTTIWATSTPAARATCSTELIEVPSTSVAHMSRSAS
jgi:hypothetical protein